MTPANIEKVIKLLRSAFKQAVRWEVIARNPFDFVTLPKVERKPREIWTAEIIRKALDSCKDAKLFVAMNLAFACSLRVGEILGLTWDITNAEAGHGLMKIGKALIPFVNRFPKNTELYRYMTTKPGETEFWG